MADAEKTVKVRYVGPLTAVEIMDDEQLVTVAQGETLEVSAADAAWLCQQDDNWELVGADPKRRKAAKDDKPDDEDAGAAKDGG
jgi:hypothetical protein